MRTLSFALCGALLAGLVACSDPLDVTNSNQANTGQTLATPADLETLGKKIEIKMFDFDRELVPVEAPGPATNGEMTAHGPVLDAIPNTADRKRVAGEV